MDTTKQDKEDAGPIDQRKPNIYFQSALILLVWTPLLVWLYGYEANVEGKIPDPDDATKQITVSIDKCGVPVLNWLRVIFTTYLVNTCFHVIFIKFVFVP